MLARDGERRGGAVGGLGQMSTLVGEKMATGCFFQVLLGGYGSLY